MYKNRFMLPLTSKIFLFPYWLVLKIRHFLYDHNIKKGTTYPIPVICVGNITVGGTGKTPHTEMIIRNLQSKFKIAVLSRGYKRQTKGFVLATPTSTYKEIGDEPMQIKNKFPDTIVAVCANRREGIEKLLQLEQKPDIILLDDAFQHRRVRPSHSIVLMNYNAPIYNDNLLPIGRLRDLPEQIKRAQSVIVTKSPLFGERDGIIQEDIALQEIGAKEVFWKKKLKLSGKQELYFSIIKYGDAVGVDNSLADARYLYSKSAIFFTGIANNSEFANYISDRYSVLDSITFPDHCNFKYKEIQRINNWVKKYPQSVIFTTEKDSKRLSGNSLLSKEARKRLFYLPIEVKIIPESREVTFLNQIAGCN